MKRLIGSTFAIAMLIGVPAQAAPDHIAKQNVAQREDEQQQQNGSAAASAAVSDPPRRQNRTVAQLPETRDAEAEELRLNRVRPLVAGRAATAASLPGIRLRKIGDRLSERGREAEGRAGTEASLMEIRQLKTEDRLLERARPAAGRVETGASSTGIRHFKTEDRLLARVDPAEGRVAIGARANSRRAGVVRLAEWSTALSSSSGGRSSET